MAKRSKTVLRFRDAQHMARAIRALPEVGSPYRRKADEIERALRDADEAIARADTMRIDAIRAAHAALASARNFWSDREIERALAETEER